MKIREYDNVQDKLRKQFKKLGLRHQAVADHFGISKSHFSQMMSGRKPIPLKRFFDICEFMGMEVKLCRKKN